MKLLRLIYGIVTLPYGILRTYYIVEYSLEDLDWEAVRWK